MRFRKTTLIQAITFDFWNTLFEARSGAELRVRRIQRVLSRAGYRDVSDSNVQQAIGHAWQEWNRVWEQECLTFGAEHWVSLILAHLNIRLPPSDRADLVQGMATSGIDVAPPLVDGVALILPQLNGRYRLGVICDTGLSPGWMLRQHLENHDILQYFSHLTFSDEIGVSKPHPDAFLTTLTHLDVSPDRSVHIGDFPRTDIAGALNVGMRAIRFSGVHDWHHDTIRANAEIASYADLEPLLHSWNQNSAT
jgi:putative hydrolase of the HAD superfamily